ncbi:Ig-like domain-containing protein [Pseudoalteromonas sp. Of11M-6]|uniref:Ig-like domain-containing protein n=1 Tax=Pseudoalteromonas sp. Of11M-6 TaxID=2917754 RepID=UPI001EF67958|nr:Ig-like domain-containing protein [Pseudoalteromonas sp. Of11M-6]MCG7556050.1 Ig-like domain-containing protein [Pseudoalteromonas sp. Of11M-6]
MGQLRSFCYLVLLFLLTACGGGSDAGNSDSSKGNSQVPQTAISFAETSIQILVDEIPSVNKISGSSGTGAITFSSSDSSIVEVVNPQTGQIKGVGAGSATITVSKSADAQYQSASASYSVEVNKREQEPLLFDAGHVAKFVSDSNFTNPLNGGSGDGAFVFTSSNTGVATVNSTSGEIQIIGAGQVEISVTKHADLKFKPASASFALSIKKREQTPLKFNYETVNVFVDDSPAINMLIGGSGTGSISYSSSNPDVATINLTSGEVTFVGKGTTTIKATKSADGIYNSAEASYSLTLNKRNQDDIVFEQDSLYIYLDETKTNRYTGGSGEGKVTYSTSNAEVVLTHTFTGLLTPVKAGSATITLTKSGDTLYEPQTAQFTVNVTKKEQEPLSFQSSSLDLLIDTPIQSNPLSGGTGSGTITYHSSDTSVVDVNSKTGKLTLLKDGVATISATKASDALYNESTASYDVDISYILDELSIAISLTNAELTWSKQSQQLEVYRSTDANCDITNYTACDNSQMNIISAQDALPLQDGFINIQRSKDTLEHQSAYIKIAHEDYISNTIHVTPSLPPFKLGNGAQMVSFKGKLWLMGGEYYKGDDTIWQTGIWSSTDGINWQLEVEKAPFQGRAHFELIEFNEQLYLIGGERGVGTNGAKVFESDVWRSDDGVNWTLIQPTPGVYIGKVASAIVFQGKLWLYGDSYSSENSTIYSTEDGLNWTMQNSSAAYTPRSKPTLFVHNDHLWMYGGQVLESNKARAVNEIWSSEDGVNWRLRNAAPNIPNEYAKASKVFNFNGKLWMISGQAYNANDSAVNGSAAYSSDNGIDWTIEASPIISRFNTYLTGAKFADKLWIYSGWQDEYIWHSKDGKDWRTYVELPQLEWSPRQK